MCNVLVRCGWFSLKSAQTVTGRYVKYLKCALQKKHDKSLTYPGSGLRVAYAQHAFFIFVNIDEKGMSERPFRLRGLRRMTQKRTCNP